MQWPSDHTGNHFPLCYDILWFNHLVSLVLALSIPHTSCHIHIAVLFLSSLTFQWYVDKDTGSLKIAKLYKCSIQSAPCLVCEWAVWIRLMLCRRRSDIDPRQMLTVKLLKLLGFFCLPPPPPMSKLPYMLFKFVNRSQDLWLWQCPPCKQPKYTSIWSRGKSSAVSLSSFPHTVLLCTKSAKTSTSLLICQNLRLHN